MAETVYYAILNREGLINTDIVSKQINRTYEKNLRAFKTYYNRQRKKDKIIDLFRREVNRFWQDIEI